MSYEGRYQIVCENGHYYEINCYEFSYGSSNCPTCGADILQFNSVDDTNGDSDGWVEPILLSEKICEHCKTVLEQKYTLNK